MNKPNIVKQAKIVNLIIYSIMAGIGLILLVIPSAEIQIEVILLSILCMVVGSVKILGYFSNDLYRLAFQFDLAVGFFLIVIGILTLIFERENLDSFGRLFGIYVLFDGLLKVQTSIDARKFGINRWLIMLLTSLLVVAAGVVIFISPYLQQISKENLLYICLMIDGFVNIWITAYTVRVRAKKKNFEDMLEDSE